MSRDDGVQVRVPASKLAEFDPSDTEITDAHRKLAAAIARRLKERYPDPPQS